MATTMKEYMEEKGLNKEWVCLHFQNGMVYPERATPSYPLGMPVRIGGGIFIAEGSQDPDAGAATLVRNDGEAVLFGPTRLFPFDHEIARNMNLEDFKRINRCTYSTMEGETVIVTGVKMRNDSPGERTRVMTQLPGHQMLSSCSRCGCMIPFAEELGAGWDDGHGGRMCLKCMDSDEEMPRRKKR